MRWQTHPAYGERRTIRRFAWYPMDCDNRRTVWLEWVVEVQEYGDGGWGGLPGWERVSRTAA